MSSSAVRSNNISKPAPEAGVKMLQEAAAELVARRDFAQLVSR